MGEYFNLIVDLRNLIFYFEETYKDFVNDLIKENVKKETIYDNQRTEKNPEIV